MGFEDDSNVGGGGCRLLSVPPCGGLPAGRVIYIWKAAGRAIETPLFEADGGALARAAPVLFLCE